MESKSSSVTVHGQWSSGLMFVFATTGAAVGLANIWKFSYTTGENGGSAFVLVYLLCVVLIGIPTMISEVMIGRQGRQNASDSMKQLAQQYRSSPKWGLIGWCGSLCLWMMLSFYSVVAGWSLAYMVKAFAGDFNQGAPEHISLIWGNFLQSPWMLLLWHSVFMFCTLFTVYLGVQKGIEKASKILLPALLVILVILVCYGAIAGDMKTTLTFLFSFNFSEFTPSVILAALGQAFFSLAIGAGCLLVYGAYLPKTTRIGHTLGWVALLDTLVALLAGLAIFPILFAYQLPPSEGPGLMFKVLPIAFGQMPFGQWIGGAFFILLFFAALSSSISLAEPLVMKTVEKAKVSRLSASLWIGISAWCMGIGALLSFNRLADFKLFSQWTIFDVLTDIPINILLPLGGLGFTIFAGWVIPTHLSKQTLALESDGLYKLWLYLTRFVTPLGIIIIFITNFI